MSRISEWAQQFGVFIDKAEVIPGENVYRIKDIFTTRDGSWEPSDKPGSVPQWARDEYLKPIHHPQYNSDAGADRHLFGAVMGSSGNLLPVGDMHFYTYTDNGNHSTQRVKMHGWANIPLYGSSATPGPWAWYPKNKLRADVVKGGGLPGGLHVSWFVVWQAATDSGVIIAPPPTDNELDKLRAENARLRSAVAAALTLLEAAI